MRYDYFSSNKPDNSTIFQKVVANSEKSMQAWVNAANEYASIGIMGSTSIWKDCSHLNTSQSLCDGFRLNYVLNGGKSSYASDGCSVVYVVRYRTTKPQNAKIPILVKDEVEALELDMNNFVEVNRPYPFTGNGFTPGESTLGAPELYVHPDPQSISEAIIVKIEGNEETVVGITDYDENQNQVFIYAE